MERQVPKNVRQVGNVSDEPKIYVEDYVDTYLNQLRGQAKEHPVGAFLTGDIQKSGQQECVYITGAVRIPDPVGENTEIVITDESCQKIKEESETYFREDKPVGWFLILPEKPLEINSNITRIHEKYFSQKNSVFIMKDAFSEEEIYYAYKYHELMQMGGHYIFYEKNPQMQDYIISTRRQNGVTPSEVVEDRAAKNFRSTMREQMTGREQRTGARFAYMTSALLVVIVLAIGISTMNNYDKMNAVQTSIESLSKSVQQPEGQEAIEKAEVTEEVQADAAEAQADEAETQDAGAEAQDTGQEAQDAGAGTQDSSGEADQSDEPDGAQDAADQAEPVTSTIQEELSSEEYYVVQKGDTLDRISQKIYGTTGEVDAICRMNGLTDGNLIFIGQKLLLP
ncbi:LysM peptidoglycan-binding domain-containing protein [Dorea acetigenes]|jgi:LysM repeat protein|uniref:LysM peptidoglycan-binding domain-containing protein n=1 Tax=Dorea acetigenes TaxID=2981787 RepID=A0ABT2RS92_9FIRM|nr:LysM peptidoglycan-binding domain-containing protein [Dorea acetigenes]MCU6688009.1 LysM peptidoglycan-binding domain-containing protein [Dorea acetigenes]SCJ63472.1 LysM domain/BON superfamily protein [uncultured Clostridium sp.]